MMQKLFASMLHRLTVGWDSPEPLPNPPEPSPIPPAPLPRPILVSNYQGKFLVMVV